jgi:hypothetical protein
MPLAAPGLVPRVPRHARRCPTRRARRPWSSSCTTTPSSSFRRHAPKVQRCASPPPPTSDRDVRGSVRACVRALQRRWTLWIPSSARGRSETARSAPTVSERALAAARRRRRRRPDTGRPAVTTNLRLDPFSVDRSEPLKMCARCRSWHPPVEYVKMDFYRDRVRRPAPPRPAPPRPAPPLRSLAAAVSAAFRHLLTELRVAAACRASPHRCRRWPRSLSRRTRASLSSVCRRASSCGAPSRSRTSRRRGADCCAHTFRRKGGR